jgi:hypothetical protein
MPRPPQNITPDSTSGRSTLNEGISVSLRVGFGFFRKTGPGSQKKEFIKSYDRQHTIIKISVLWASASVSAH